jgi:hypothetical protein
LELNDDVTSSCNSYRRLLRVYTELCAEFVSVLFQGTVQRSFNSMEHPAFLLVVIVKLVACHPERSEGSMINIQVNTEIIFAG